MNASVFARLGDPRRVNERVCVKFVWLVATAALTIRRAFCVVFFSAIALLQVTFIHSKRITSRARWLHQWCRFACRILDLSLTREGPIPRAGLLVCNHLSYLDIITLSALVPCAFVAKREVRSWPLFGWLARAAGTIFVDRNRRSNTGSAIMQIREALDSGLLVVLFPEGTSSNGSTVLPFRSSLLEAAVLSQAPIAAAGLDYHLRHGSVADEVCYWRDMTLLPHLLNLFGKPEIEVDVHFSPAQVRAKDRKLIARQLRTEVMSLRR